MRVSLEGECRDKRADTYTSRISPVHAQVLQKQHRLMLAPDELSSNQIQQLFC